MKLDLASLLVEARGEDTLGAIEARLAEVDRTLDVDASAHPLTVREWIDRGAPGARDPWLDPVDQIVAGFEATLRDGRTLSVRPAPRRAVGPDLSAMVLGMDRRFATITRAWIRIHDRDARRPTAPFHYPRDPELTDGERALLAAIEREV